jgi:ABC-2 type transport system permease protein
MKPMILVARRELGSYLNTVWGWGILALVLLIDGLWFNSFAVGSTAKYSSDVLEDFFYGSSGTTMIAGILLTIRVIAEERQTGTLVILQKAPISEAQIIFGKFLGAFGFLMVVTLLTVYMPMLIFVNGKVSPEQIAAGYLGLIALAATTVAIGTFGSAVSRNQLLAGVVGAGVLVVMLLGWMLGRVTEEPINGVMSYMALFDRHFQPFMRGRINTESLVYFGSVTFAFLMLATRALGARRWQ